MLNMGFREDIETILSGVPEERQTVLFSATMPKAIMEITKKFQKNAQVVKVTKKELTVPNIEQFYYEVRPKNKEEVLNSSFRYLYTKAFCYFLQHEKAGGPSCDRIAWKRIFCGGTSR